MEQLWKNSAKVEEQGKNLYKLLDASLQRLFVFAYFIAAGSYADQEPGIKDNKKYFLPRGEIKNYNVLIDGRNFYDQPINDLIKQYDEVRKVSMVMIIQLVVYWIMHISNIITD